MNHLTTLICLAAVAGTSAGVSAQQDERDPNWTPTPFTNGNSRGLGDLISGPFDVETAPYDNRCLGVEEAWGHYWVTGRGHVATGDNYMIHKYDTSGTFIASYPQNVSSSNLGGWGGRDMEADEAGNLLYVGNDNGFVEVMSYDPATGALSYFNTVFTTVSGTVRALCQNPTSGNFFTKSFTGDIYEFDMNTGSVVNSFVNTAVSSYGFGWDYAQGTIWSTDVSASATELDPATGMGTGRMFTTGGMGVAAIQGGGDVFNDPASASGGPSFLMLGQGTPDSIASYDTVGAPPPPPPPFPNLPTSFVSASGYMENFDGAAGTVPAHMAINANDTFGAADPFAWCNIGQQGACGQETGSYLGTWAANGSGAYCLELGGDPLVTTGFHDVRNGLAIGLNGAGQGALSLDFGIVDHGEEADVWDGIWLSEDGVNYINAYSAGWVGLGNGIWTNEAGIDLSSVGVNTDGDFYMVICQEDNYPMGYLDGLQIDDISIVGTGPPGPSLTLSNLVGGQTCSVDVANCTANGVVYFAYSLAGGGPTTTPFGDASLSPPWKLFPLVADSSGDASMTANVPAHATGAHVWTQAADVSMAVLSNPVDQTIG